MYREELKSNKSGQESSEMQRLLNEKEELENNRGNNLSKTDELKEKNDILEVENMIKM